MEHITHASLFSGIGGFDLAAEWIGWHNAFNCEINPFCRRILNYHFPDSISYEDITTTDFSPWRGHIDILTGGFPCQPFSYAGQRRGKDDNRYLWPHMLRAIRQIQPAYVIGENVAGILTMVQPGQTVTLGRETTILGTDNTHQIHRCRYTLDTICQDLERENYTVQPFVIPACAVGAPHRRDRVWIIAHHNSDRCRHRTNQPKPITRSSSAPDDSIGSTEEPITDTASCGSCRAPQESSATTKRPDRKPTQQSQFRSCIQSAPHPTSQQSYRPQPQQPDTCRPQQTQPRGSHSTANSEHHIPHFHNFPTQSPICGGNDGLPRELDSITFPHWRAESVKAYGNAIVPQVAYEIFLAIQSTL